MSVVERRRGASCEVSEKWETISLFMGHIVGLKNSRTRNQNTLETQFGVLVHHLASLLFIAVWGAGNFAHTSLQLEKKVTFLHLLRTSGT